MGHPQEWKRIGSSQMKLKRNWADLYVMFQDHQNHRWTNNSPGPHPYRCQVLEEMEINMEDKWWLEEDHSLLLKKEKKQIHFLGRVARRGFALCHSRRGDRRDDIIKTVVSSLKLSGWIPYSPRLTILGCISNQKRH
ncbi:hypothetical protein MA16_Dca000304 [Dendrobium catenatum]|uniref:Uncharacterized protein n=1 Tax=Dendrobium catenatum TaxID=906689 RepID=A0A2I0WTH1_9ASPA|nr:hypothetical protein MA16_Dca000304 [Dendrobium catenatum]